MASSSVNHDNGLAFHLPVRTFEEKMQNRFHLWNPKHFVHFTNELEAMVKLCTALHKPSLPTQ